MKSLYSYYKAPEICPPLNIDQNKNGSPSDQHCAYKANLSDSKQIYNDNT